MKELSTLRKPVEAFQLSHKSFCNHHWYRDDVPLETWLCGNYNTTLHKKRVERDSTYLEKDCPQVGHKVVNEQLDKVHC